MLPHAFLISLISLTRFQLPNVALCLDWFDNFLAYGHDLGVTVLSQITDSNEASYYPTEFQKRWAFRKNYFHLGKPVELVRYHQQQIAAVHPTFDITLINTQSGKTTALGGSSGHSSYINSVDISSEGLVASTGDDRTLLVWEKGVPYNFSLGGAGKVVKFWSTADGDNIAVLEAGNKIRILNYRTREWILTIYPGQAGCCGPSSGAVKDIMIVDQFLFAVGIGWWKKYDLTNIFGGCGFTSPAAESRFSRSPSSSFPAVSTSKFIGLATPTTQYIHDTSKGSDATYALDYTLPGDEITGAAIRSAGDVFAIASGNLLSLVRNT